MVVIQKWTGRETRALREALRMSVREFADRLGVSDRAVSKWEAGGVNFEPRSDSQAILDVFLRKAPEEAHVLFEMFLGGGADAGKASPEATTIPGSTDEGYPRTVTHPIDGKLMAAIDGGVFPAGPNNQPTLIATFYMDVHPVTNQQYAKFVKETSRTAPSHWVERKAPGGFGAHPVVNVTYRDAVAYASWAQKRLPTALEWEKAARGPQGNVFPWGNQETPAKCNVRQTGVRGTTPVDRYHSGVSHYDIYDLAGNVWEWCSTETDPGRFVLKGSAFTSPLSMAAGAAMNDASETMLDDDTGFRCVVPPETITALLENL